MKRNNMVMAMALAAVLAGPCASSLVAQDAYTPPYVPPIPSPHQTSDCHNAQSPPPTTGFPLGGPSDYQDILNLLQPYQGPPDLMSLDSLINNADAEIARIEKLIKEMERSIQEKKLAIAQMNADLAAFMLETQRLHKLLAVLKNDPNPIFWAAAEALETYLILVRQKEFLLLRGALIYEEKLVEAMERHLQDLKAQLMQWLAIRLRLRIYFPALGGTAG